MMRLHGRKVTGLSIPSQRSKSTAQHFNKASSCWGRLHLGRHTGGSAKSFISQGLRTSGDLPRLKFWLCHSLCDPGQTLNLLSLGTAFWGDETREPRYRILGSLL